MVFIFALLSLMLTLGGGATALYGADLIRSESGLALTQAGVTMTSAGLLLMGLTAVLAELRKMRRLMELEEAAPAPLPVPRAPVAMPAIDLPPLQQPAPSPPVDIPTPPPPAPKVPFSIRDIDPPERPIGGGGIPPEAMASLVSSTPLVRGKGGAGGRVEPVAAPPAPPPTPVVEPPKAAEPPAAAAEPAAETSPAPAVPTAEAPVHPAEPPAVVASEGPRRMLATYNAGGITYFMYSDGSIEADLAAGRHRFGSMQELRHYIETGEGGTPVPASETASELAPAAGH